MKGILWSLVALVAMVAALITGLATSHAAMDNELSIDDSQGRTLNIQQWDVFLNGVTPLDMNPLTREWFHSGRAVYHVSGDGADDFTGTLELGYQVSFPWQLGNASQFQLYDAEPQPRSISNFRAFSHCRGAARHVAAAHSRRGHSTSTLATDPGSMRFPRSRSTFPEPTARWRSPALTVQ